MKRYLIILLAALFLSGCSKENKVNTSGTVTVDNTLYTATSGTTSYYYPLGFSFSSAEKVPSITGNEQSVTIDNDGTRNNLILQTNSFSNSFFKFGEFDDEASAKKAFDNLTSATVSKWVVWADSLKQNQVWIFRTLTETYAKIRIIETVSEERNNRNYSECTFEWAYQPNGTLTFPGK